MSDEDIKFGIIDESSFQLRSPRVIDSDAHDSLATALREVADMVDDGITDSVSIVRCKYSLKHDCWYELVDGGSVQIASHNWVDEDTFQAERKARREAKAIAKQAAALAKQANTKP